MRAVLGSSYRSYFRKIVWATAAVTQICFFYGNEAFSSLGFPKSNEFYLSCKFYLIYDKRVKGILNF